MASRTREKLVTEGLDAVMMRKKCETPPFPEIFDGEAQAKLTALACSAPPPGHARWTIRLLAEHGVERPIVPVALFNTVGRALKKNGRLRTRRGFWSAIARRHTGWPCLTRLQSDLPLPPVTVGGAGVAALPVRGRGSSGRIRCRQTPSRTVRRRVSQP